MTSEEVLEMWKSIKTWSGYGEWVKDFAAEHYDVVAGQTFGDMTPKDCEKWIMLIKTWKEINNE